ncbi:MAG: ribonuclease J [Pseudomonadota bacterium]
MSGEELVYAALGGAGEIGMNMYLYGFGPEKDRRWIMVDCGVTFGDAGTTPGVDIILPDVDFIAGQRKRLLGILITHAHEDHVGAIGRLWGRLRAPIYTTPFTAEIAKRKLEEEGVKLDALKSVRPMNRFTLGPFDAMFHPITHSVPGAMALHVKTPLGAILHTGDFKFDAEPLIGPPPDEASLKALGDEGLLCLACDSTNVLEPGEAGSEASVRPGIEALIREASGAVAATCFASNVARLRTVAQIGRDNGRSVVVAGRAMRRMIDAALETRAIPDFPETVSDEDARDLPSEHALYLVTGSQGESRAALARIATGQHPTVSLEEGDLVLFSSRTIPGNEREVGRLCNRLSERGVRVVDADHAHIHVSGHGCRDEMRRMYGLLRPQIALPIHGEHRHLAEHARMARAWGAEHAMLAPNGMLVRLADAAGGPPAHVEEIDSGRVYLDGTTPVGALDGVIRSRLRLARQGHVSIALVVDEEGELIADPEVRVTGAPTDGEGWPSPLDEMIADAVDAAVERMKPKERRSDQQIEEVASAACRRLCDKRWGKKPEVTAMVIRLEEEEE